LFVLVLFFLVSRTSLSCFRLLLHFIRVRLTRPPGGSKRDTGEASGGRLEPIPLLNSSQRHQPPHDSISHTKTDDQRILYRTADLSISSALAVFDILSRAAQQS
jgi:hypothetical protein